MFWQKIGNSVSDRLFRDSVRDSVIAENQCLYYNIGVYMHVDSVYMHVGSMYIGVHAY